MFLPFLLGSLRKSFDYTQLPQFPASCAIRWSGEKARSVFRGICLTESSEPPSLMALKLAASDLFQGKSPSFWGDPAGDSPMSPQTLRAPLSLFHLPPHHVAMPRLCVQVTETRGRGVVKAAFSFGLDGNKSSITKDFRLGAKNDQTKWPNDQKPDSVCRQVNHI